MRTDYPALIFWAAVIGLGIYLTIRYLWPLLLVAALMILVGVWRTRKMVKDAEEEAAKMMDESDRFQNDLFYEQVERNNRRTGDIIDAEFTVKEKEGEKHD